MAHERPRAALLMADDTRELLFDAARLERLRALVDVGEADASVEVLLTSWGAPRLTAERLARMPRLHAVFHCAGSVRGLVSDDLWRRGVLVTTAADANAVPVAEFTVAAIVLANKGALRAFRDPRAAFADWSPTAHAPDLRVGNLGRRIGVVGFSRVGRRVVDLLRGLDDMDVLVADPVADADEVAAAGARLVPLVDLLPAVDVLSLHAPELPATRRMIGARELAALRDGATIVNTARGALVDHDALLAECRAGRLDAVLDVTDPEPLPADSGLYDLPNVVITPHLAGSVGTEARRLADAALDDLETWLAGGVPHRRVVADDLGLSA
ncbi:hydroxyacid dehydrogenase [Agromyces sp. MMS24-K17]|uniref:hydroxyacid dehydrogenase n=1 Tax=Agromyces sp. MMS24-K17 TaxID=3372850 RepID=UPI003754706A